MARPAGFEPATFGSGGPASNRLYQAVMFPAATLSQAWWIVAVKSRIHWFVGTERHNRSGQRFFLCGGPASRNETPVQGHGCRVRTGGHFMPAQGRWPPAEARLSLPGPLPSLAWQRTRATKTFRTFCTFSRESSSFRRHGSANGQPTCGSRFCPSTRAMCGPRFSRQSPPNGRAHGVLVVGRVITRWSRSCVD